MSSLPACGQEIQGQSGRSQHANFRRPAMSTTRSPQPTLARAPRHYLSPARPGHLQSGPESTGYLTNMNFPPCSTFDRSTQSLRLESRGPICPQGLPKKQTKSIVCNIGRFGCNSRQRYALTILFVANCLFNAAHTRSNSGSFSNGAWITFLSPPLCTTPSRVHHGL
jgi:hypothetical protein